MEHSEPDAVVLRNDDPDKINSLSGKAVYVLKLQEPDHWYIGATTDPQSRIHSHFGNWAMESSVWAERHGVEEAYVGWPNYDYFGLAQIEKRLTRVFIEEFSLDTVRGSVWTSPDEEELPRLSIIDPKIPELFAQQFQNTPLSWIDDYSVQVAPTR